MPNSYFVDAVTVNDVNAQQRFYSRETGERLRVFARDGREPERTRRLQVLREGRYTYRLIRQVELVKMALSEEAQAVVGLEYLEPQLQHQVRRAAFEASARRLLQHLESLVTATIGHAQSKPDVLYLTGGMARSLIVRQWLERLFPDTPLVDSDHFASVTEGLTLWARQVFG